MRAARLVQLGVLSSLALVTACSGSSGTSTSDPTVAPKPTSTCVFGGATVSADCLPSNLATATGLPTDSSAITAIVQPVPPEELNSFGAKPLAGAANDKDPALTTASFSVTVPAGHYLAADLQCLGDGTVEFSTTPASNASASDIACNGDLTTPAESIEFADKTASTTVFQVKLTAQKGLRWGLTMFSLATLPPSSS